MFKLKKFYFLAFTILSSCVQKSESINDEVILFDYDDFGIEIILDGPQTLLASDSLFKPTKIHIVRNYLFVTERVSQNVMHVIHNETGDYLGMRGNRGAGPNEVLDVWQFLDEGSERLGVFDIEQGKILVYNLDSLVSGNNMPSEVYQHQDLIFSKSIDKDQSLIFSTGNPIQQSESEDRFYSLDLKSNSMPLGLDQVPFEDLKIDGLPDEFINKVRYNAKLFKLEQKIISYYQDLPMFEIYDLDTNSKKAFIGPDELNLSREFGSLYYYSDVFRSDKYIYFLYVTNREFKDYNANAVLVFDHSGKPVKRYVLEKPIFSFSIYKDEHLYGLSEGSDRYDYEIIKYNLK
ncbi:BF3164 family lipoprotein [Algoriphagus namhaensis]